MLVEKNRKEAFFGQNRKPIALPFDQNGVPIALLFDGIWLYLELVHL